MRGPSLEAAVRAEDRYHKSLGRLRRSALSLLMHSFAVLFFGICFPTSNAEADSQKLDVEHLVFEDCGMARMMVGHLPPDQLEKGLVTLVSTIRLGLRGPGNVAGETGQLAGSGIPRIPGHGELPGDIVIMSLDPGRNERARRCSIELLRNFLPARPLVMRELMALAEDPDILAADRALAKEIRDIVVAVAEEVASAMSHGEAILLIEPLIREKSGVVLRHWHPVLRLFAVDSINLISRKYLASSEFDPSLLDLLISLDPSGEMSMRLIENTHLPEDVETRMSRMLTWMRKVNLPVDRAIHLLIPALVSAYTANTFELLKTIAAIFPVRESFVFSDKIQFIASFVLESVSSWRIVLQESLRIGNPGIRCVQQCNDEDGQTGLVGLWCDRRLLNSYRRIIDDFVRSDSPLLGTSWPAIATLPIEDAELESHLRQSLNSAYRTVRIAAFSVYSKQPMDRGKFVSDALRLLKRPAVFADEKREIVELLARSFLTSPIGIRGLPALPLFLDYFDRPSPECGVLCAEDGDRAPLITRAIGSAGKDAFPLLVRSLESTSSQRRRLALIALGELTPVDQKIAYFLVGALRDSDAKIRDLGEQLVSRRRHEIAVRSELSKALKWSDADAAGHVAALLKEG